MINGLKYILAFILLSITVVLNAQEIGKLKVVSPLVGEVISIEEMNRYMLFDKYNIEKFKEARVYEKQDKSYELIIETEYNVYRYVLSKSQFFELKTQIEKRSIELIDIDSNFVCIVKLIDESSLTGKITRVSDRNIVLQTNFMGKLTIHKNKILDVIVLQSDGKTFKKYWFPNPHESRYYFAPTARSMSKGEGYYQNIYLVFHAVNYGINNWFTLGGGASLIPGNAMGRQVYFINPKFGFNINHKTSIGGGVLYASYPYSNEIETEVVDAYTGHVYTDYKAEKHTGSIGIIYGVYTYGTAESNATFGAGYSFIKDKWMNSPVLTLSYMGRMSRRTAFVTENWLLPLPGDSYYPKDFYPTGIVSYGIRFFGEKMCVDLAFFNTIGERGIDEFIFPGIPYIDFVVKF